MKRESNFELGDHLYVDCGGYSHHGIFAGDDLVIHFDSTAARKVIGTLNGLPPHVTEVSMEEFSGGKIVYVRDYSQAVLAAEEIVKRARSRIGERGYDLFDNNCEHFAVWCKTGENHSSQIDAARKAATTGAAGLALGTAIARSARVLPGPYKFLAYGASAAVAIGSTTYRYILERKNNRRKNLS